MEASGIGSLDEVTDAVDGRGRTYRQRGCILRVVIFYQNWYSTWIGTRQAITCEYINYLLYSVHYYTVLHTCVCLRATIICGYKF